MGQKKFELIGEAKIEKHDRQRHPAGHVIHEKDEMKKLIIWKVKLHSHFR